MEFVKGRKLEQGQKVKVYRNLHKDCISVVDNKSGLVVAHTQQILLKNVQFKVSEAGRQRVLKEKRKNVHAYLVGEFVTSEVKDLDGIKQQAYYNPYTTKHFIDLETGCEVKFADLALLVGKKVFFKNKSTRH